MKRKSVIIFALLIVLLAPVMVGTVEGYVPVTLPVDGGIGFNNGNYLFFNAETAFSSLQQVDDSNSTFGGWVFVDGYGFYADGCDLTVSNLYTGKKLSFSTDGATGTTQTVKVYSPTFGDPVKMLGADTKSYTAPITTITLHNDDSLVTLDWNEPETAGGGPGGIIPSASPSPSVTVDPSVSPSPSGIFNLPINGDDGSWVWLVFVAAAVIVVVLMASQGGGSPSIKTARKNLKKNRDLTGKRPKPQKKSGNLTGKRPKQKQRDSYL